jgi:hypothetical protein
VPIPQNASSGVAPPDAISKRCDFAIDDRAAGLKLIVALIDFIWMRRSLAADRKPGRPTPAERERVAPASASRSGADARVGTSERRWQQRRFPFGTSRLKSAARAVRAAGLLRAVHPPMLR